MSADANTAVELEIAHVLFIDTVGYSKRLINEQREIFGELNRVVKNTHQFQVSEGARKLIRLPTGDGMALVFLDSPEAPVRCALEISEALRSDSHLPLRMGIHSGPVSRVMDVNDQSNAAGAGINIAQRVMACGDAGHILVSKRTAEDLAGYRDWQPFLHEIGEYEVKHGTKVSLVNFYSGEIGNPALPAHCRELQRKSYVQRRKKILWVSGIATAAIGLSAAGYAFFIYKARSEPVSAKSIAVLPFVNLSEEKQNEYFTDGMQDEILNDLAKVADLKVISRTSVMQYRNAAARNLRQIAKELGVAHVLEGSVQRVGDRVRVSAQLIDARTDMHVWADRYDSELADVFRIQSEVAEQIVAQLKAKLSPREKAAIEERPTRDLTAYDLYLRARSLIDARAFDARQKENLIEAIRLLSEAVARDERFLLARYQLASAHDLLYFDGFDHTPQRLALADEAINALVRVQPNSGEAHLALAQHLYWAYSEYDRARQELDIARGILPNEPRVLVLAGYIDRRQGRWDESIRAFEGALKLDPRNLFILQQVSFNYENLRRFKEMAAVLERVLTINPTDNATRLQRALVELESHADTRPAHAVMETILKEDPKAAASVSDRWTYLALYERDVAAGMRATALLPPEGISENGINFPPAWYEGVFARLRNDKDAAIQAWKRARAQVDENVRRQPDYAEQLVVLAMIDAALGQKETAIQEGKRAAGLLPVAKDVMKGSLMLEYLAIAYAWTGEKDRALENLNTIAHIPSDINYGYLRLHPYWDPLRGDPRFEELVASFAPDRQKH